MLAIVDKSGTFNGITYKEYTAKTLTHHIGRGEGFASITRQIPQTGGDKTYVNHDAVLDDNGEVIEPAYRETIDHPVVYGEPTLAEVQVGSEAVVDFLAGETREYFVSQGQLIQEEYRYAREEAQKWVDAGKPVDAIPDAVQVWMGANDMTADEVVADIEQTALAWEAALGAIRNARLTAKGAIRKATDIVAVQQVVQTARDQFEQVKATAT
tara:strand:+ start:1566 stop:2201 length:636 start_codon:yes stop_codon:yes gene_type:complete